MTKIFILVALITLTAQANVPAFWPKQSTCQEMQNAVNQYGSVLINVKYLFGSDQLETFPTEPFCDYNQYPLKMKVRTKDGSKCMVGYYCEQMSNP